MKIMKCDLCGDTIEPILSIRIKFYYYVVKIINTSTGKEVKIDCCVTCHNRRLSFISEGK